MGPLGRRTSLRSNCDNHSLSFCVGGLSRGQTSLPGYRFGERKDFIATGLHLQFIAVVLQHSVCGDPVNAGKFAVRADPCVRAVPAT